MTLVGLAILLVAIAVLIFCSGLFSGLETALFSLKSHQLRRLEEHHPSLTKFFQVFRENPRRVLNVLLLGDGLVKVPLVVLCLFLLWEGPLAARVPQWLAAVAIFALAFAGLAYSLFPYVVMDRMTIWEAASHPSALKFMLVGVAIVLPFLVAYTAFAYRVFRGKARTGLYE